MTPRVVILAAPSGGGKTTIAHELIARRRDVGFSVSATTREPRSNERDGVDYHFLTQDEFQRRVAAGEFLESAEYAGNLYGTLKAEVDRVLAGGRHVLLDIEVQGARQVLQTYPKPRSIDVFIWPPNGAELVRRLTQRQTESPEALARRLDQAVTEIQQSLSWSHIVVNDALDRTVAEVSSIIDEDGRVLHKPSVMKPYDLVKDLRIAADKLRNLGD